MDKPRNSRESKEKLEGKITEGEVDVEKRNTSKGLFDSLFTVRPVSGPSLTAFGGSWPLIGRDGGLFEGEMSSEGPGGSQVKLRILLVSSVFRPAVFGSGEEDGMRE